jgi:hypothetical protein
MSQLLTFFNQPVQTNQAGLADLTGLLPVDAYDSVNLEIVAVRGTPPNITVVCNMGNLSGLGHFNGQTLAAVVDQFPLAPFDTVIHTFPVTGPEFSVQLTGGPPNVKVDFEAWIFLK